MHKRTFFNDFIMCFVKSQFTLCTDSTHASQSLGDEINQEEERDAGNESNSVFNSWLALLIKSNQKY